jgi:RNA polymerase sigma-70 factor (ECF subfamily)
MDEALDVAAPPAARESLAFDEFFESQRHRLFAALWLVCRDRAEAEELAQDAFVRVWERWERVEGLEDPAGYLYRTAMNLHRNRRRRAALALRRIVRPVPRRDELEAVEDRDAIVRALRAVTPRQRAALVLTDLLDLTSEDAARALGVRAPTVRVLAARARAALREEIGGDDG